MGTKTTTCQDCGIELSYTTKRPNLCKECHTKKFGDRKYYKQPKSIPKKSKGEFALNKILNEMIPSVAYIDGGYYSFLKSPKGFPMQLDRYYPRLHLAFEFNGKQHVEDSSFFYGSEEQWKYQQTCDELKRELCEKSNIKIIYIRHDEYVCKELVIEKLAEIGMLDYLYTKNVIS